MRLGVAMSLELVNSKTGEVLEFKKKLMYCQVCLETIQITDAENGAFEPCRHGHDNVGILLNHEKD